MEADRREVPLYVSACLFFLQSLGYLDIFGCGWVNTWTLRGRLTTFRPDAVFLSHQNPFYSLSVLTPPLLVTSRPLCRRWNPNQEAFSLWGSLVLIQPGHKSPSERMASIRNIRIRVFISSYSSTSVNNYTHFYFVSMLQCQGVQVCLSHHFLLH